MGHLCLGVDKYGERVRIAVDCHGVMHTYEGQLEGGGVVAASVVARDAAATNKDYVVGPHGARTNQRSQEGGLNVVEATASDTTTNKDYMVVSTDGTLLSYGIDLGAMVGLQGVPSRFGAAPVDSVSIGTLHMLALLRDGRVFSSGSNHSGCTGNGFPEPNNHTWYYAELTQVADETLCQIRATCVAAGEHTSFVLRADGLVYAFGQNTKGLLGLGDTVNRYWPTQQAAIPGASSPVTICASTHTLLVTRDGGMWTWGRNDDGELGLGDCTPRTSPARVPVEAICSALSAFSNTMVLTMSGRVLGCGRHYPGGRVMGCGWPDLPTGVFEPVAGAPVLAVLSLSCAGGGVIDVDGGVWSWNHAWTWLGCGKSDWTYSHGTPQLLIPGIQRYESVVPAPLALAFAMGAHLRLGEASALGAFSDDLVRRTINACVDWAPAAGESERAARSRGAPVLASLARYAQGVCV